MGPGSVVVDVNDDNQLTAGLMQCLTTISEGAGAAWGLMKKYPGRSVVGAFFCCAAIGLFSTAQETCANVYIDNKTSDSLYPYYDAPIGVDSHGSGYAGNDMNITMGGWEHATVKVLVNLAYDFTIHVHKSGLEITTSDLANNRALNRQWPGVLFWNCYYKYEYANPTKSPTVSPTFAPTTNSSALINSSSTEALFNGTSYYSSLRGEPVNLFGDGMSTVTNEQVDTFRGRFESPALASLMRNFALNENAIPQRVEEVEINNDESLEDRFSLN